MNSIEKIKLEERLLSFLNSDGTGNYAMVVSATSSKAVLSLSNGLSVAMDVALTKQEIKQLEVGRKLYFDEKGIMSSMSEVPKSPKVTARKEGCDFKRPNVF